MALLQLRKSAVRKSGTRRSDIQGLRALAVIAVMFFHAGLTIPGGFVGVDIFFVVSGFVITSSLLREHLRTGAIHLFSFYARRFKRLIPALALVVTVTVLASSLVLSPLGPQQTAAITGMAASFSLANVAISLTTGGYFDSAAELNPLLHTWTLSVEEQFYFVFPLLVMGGISLARSVTKGAGIILIAGTSVSFALAMFTPVLLNIYATEFLGFYSPLTRAWEFGVGSLAAWWLLVKPPRMTTTLARIAYVTGLALIAISFTRISATEHFPGPVTLLPVLGTALVILGGHFHPWETKDPLRSVPAVKIGDWSYSIYLWHWPFIVITSLLWPGHASAQAFAAVLSVIPAIGSYYLVEQPIRFGRFPTRKNKTLLLTLTVATPVAVSAMVWFIAEDTGSSMRYAVDRPIGYELGCHGPGLAREAIAVCEFDVDTATEEDVPIYLVGDSHAAHFTSGLLEVTSRNGSSLTVFTASSCPLLESVFRTTPGDEMPSRCGGWQRKAIERLKNSEPGIVILAASDGYWYEEQAISSAGKSTANTTSEKLEFFEDGLRRALTQISLAGHKTVLVQTVPTWTEEFDWGLDECSLTEVLDGCNQEMPLAVAIEKNSGAREVLERLGETSGSAVVDFSAAVCPQGLCQTHRDGKWIYRDFSHITNDFSIKLAPEWKGILDEVRATR